jgi:hypothetical protein
MERYVRSMMQILERQAASVDEIAALKRLAILRLLNDEASGVAVDSH